MRPTLIASQKPIFRKELLGLFDKAHFKLL